MAPRLCYLPAKFSIDCSVGGNRIRQLRYPALETEAEVVPYLRGRQRGELLTLGARNITVLPKRVLGSVDSLGEVLIIRSLTRYITLLFNRSRNRKGATRENVQIQVESFRSLLANEDPIAQIAARWTIEQINRGMSPDRAVVATTEVRLRLNVTIKLIQTGHHIQTTYVDAMERALAFPDNGLANGQWGIVTTTPDDPFIIGDAPVVTWIRNGGFLHYGFGLERPNVEVLLPVAPSRARQACRARLPCWLCSFR